MKSKVVILNAPPECGKDTIADLIVKHLHATKHEFKHTLYKAFADYYALYLQDAIHICTDRRYKDNLTSKFSIDYGITPREGLIFVSEKVFKPRYGNDYFGVKAAGLLTEGVNAFSDGGGWWDELVPVADKAEQTIICRLHRTGFSFDGDSRDYYNSSTMPESLKGKVTICDLHLEENKPYAALDAIARLLK